MCGVSEKNAVWVTVNVEGKLAMGFYFRSSHIFGRRLPQIFIILGCLCMKVKTIVTPDKQHFHVNFASFCFVQRTT